MKMALGGFVCFFLILFIMWYMLRSCKEGKHQQKQDSQATAQKRANKLSPYNTVADTSTNDSLDLEL